MAIFWVFLTFFIWSTSFTIGKMTLLCTSPIYLTGVRMLLAGLIMMLFLLFCRRKDLRLKKEQVITLLLLSLMAVYVTNVLEFWGLQYLTAAKSCFIYSLSPFLSALFSYFQFREKVTLKKVIGLCIGFIGFLPVMIEQGRGEAFLGGIGIFSWAEIAMMGAVVASVYGWVLLRKLGREGMSPIMANGSAMVIGGSLALLHSWCFEGGGFFPVSNPLSFFQGVFLLITISNLICYNMYGWLLKRFTATFLSIAGLMTPLFAAFFGYVLLGESVSTTFFLSMAVIGLGLWLVYSEELRQGYIQKRKVPVA